MLVTDTEYPQYVVTRGGLLYCVDGPEEHPRVEGVLVTSNSGPYVVRTEEHPKLSAFRRPQEVLRAEWGTRRVSRPDRAKDMIGDIAQFLQAQRASL